jgi:hypothetical protein
VTLPRDGCIVMPDTVSVSAEASLIGKSGGWTDSDGVDGAQAEVVVSLTGDVCFGNVIAPFRMPSAADPLTSEQKEAALDPNPTAPAERRTFLHRFFQRFSNSNIPAEHVSGPLQPRAPQPRLKSLQAAAAAPTAQGESDTGVGASALRMLVIPNPHMSSALEAPNPTLPKPIPNPNPTLLCLNPDTGGARGDARRGWAAAVGCQGSLRGESSRAVGGAACGGRALDSHPRLRRARVDHGPRRAKPARRWQGASSHPAC